MTQIPVSASTLLHQLGELGQSPRDYIQFLKSILTRNSHVYLFPSLEDGDKLAFIDILDQAMNSDHSDSELLEKGLPALRKLCGQSGILPSSHKLTEELIKCGDAPLASGGFGDVWKGTYGERHVAIKIVRFYASYPVEKMRLLRKQFCKEVVTWKRLSHPNIVPFLGVSSSPALSPFSMISEWMSQGNLRQYVVGNPEANRLRLLVEIASGLHYLHSRQIVHGDLKGDNILVDDADQARLCDFGYASFAVTLNISTSMEWSCGTTQWMAPELYDTGEANHEYARPSVASDVYALSMVLIEVFTGRTPFDNLRKETVILRTVTGHRPKRPEARELGLSDAVWQMAQECWRKEPEQRPPMWSVLERLKKAHSHFSRHYLINSDHTSKETISELRRILSSEQDMLLQLRGNDAQMVIETIDQAMESRYADARLREEGLIILRKLCSICGLLPYSHMITGKVRRLSDVPVASGGFGDIWKGMYNNRQVAIKVMRVYQPHLVDRVTKRFCKEVVAWKRMSHPNIVRFIGTSSDISPFCMVSEWMPKGNVRQYLRSNSEANRRRLLVGIAEGLNYLHSANVVHGDLKGENVLVNDAGEACICDFALSSIASILVGSTGSRSFGSVRWMAPELFDIEHFTPKPTKATDVYSFAMVSIEVFTRLLPFHQYANDTMVIFRVLRGERPMKPENPSEVGLSEALWMTIKMCWHEDAEERPPISFALDSLKRIVNMEYVFQ